MAFQDTIKEIVTLGEYTLIQYVKGGEDEWCVALKYNSDTREWASGNYCYTLESAIACLLLRGGERELAKSPYQVNVEKDTDITYTRMVELATLFKDELMQDDEESAREYFEDTCEMTEEEKKFFGITEWED